MIGTFNRLLARPVIVALLLLPGPAAQRSLRAIPAAVAIGAAVVIGTEVVGGRLHALMELAVRVLP